RSDLFACGRLLEDVLAVSPLPGLRSLIDALTASDPAQRPTSARAALELIDGTLTSTTRVLPRTPRARPRARPPVASGAPGGRTGAAVAAVRPLRRRGSAGTRVGKGALAIATAVAVVVGLVVVIA